MDSLYLVIDIFASVLLLVIGSLVLARDSKSKLNRVFYLFIIALSAWILSNYFSNSQNISYSWALIANHLVLCFSSLAIYFFLWFVMLIVPDTRLLKYKGSILFAGFTVSLLALTELVIAGIEKQQDVYAVIFGPLASLYFVSLITAAIFSAALLIIGLKKASGNEHARIKTILVSLVVTVILALISNVFIPVATGSFAFTNLGPLFTIFLAAGLTYSIIKHQLFNVRLIVARSVAYVVSLAVIAVIFTATAVIMARLLLDERISLSTEIFFAIFGAVAALLFQPIKLFFDRVSNNLFYRDAYNPQEVINQVNSSLVTTVKLEELLTKTGKIIEQNLKVEFVEFYLRPNASIELHVAGSNSRLFSHSETASFLNVLDNTDIKIHVANMLVDDGEITETMKRLGLECAIKMTANNQDVGILFVGARKSGNAFTDRDIQLLDIIADEVAIAAQNALRFEEISQFANTLQARVDEATRELQRSNEKLQKLDEAKDEFISMASHQLRTPLTSVKGYISMLLEGDAGDINDTQKRFLDQAFLSSQRMVYLIADLLNVSRLKTGKFVIETHPTYLPDVVESEISQLYETAKARELDLFFNKPESFATINLDETKIRQVIMNFADNAIYYTPRGGRITVALKQLKNTIEYTVTDTGIGVPKKEQHHLFTKFYRAGNAKKARPDGTGLGLYMAKKVVIAQGGSIIFKTEEGKGSTFGFSFPVPKEIEKL